LKEDESFFVIDFEFSITKHVQQVSILEYTWKYIDMIHQL